ncbi:MAG: PBSX family phage terminase large subunit [Candidatus Gastranaerophilales bacterium]|nr:PBSX family phage terminase large subunit [Candidatus Gastranaerophilales bacterium]
MTAKVTQIQKNFCKVPEILNIPKKLYPLIINFNKYPLFYIEGGRGSGKTENVGRFILWLCEQRKLRVCCGRVIKESIKESLHTLFVEIVKTYSLNFDVSENRIIHRKTGSIIFFKGFREQEIVNIKGLQGVDILWIDEAETVTKRALEVIVPTIRKQNSVIIFTMNRYVKSDAVHQYCIAHPKCLHIHIDYFDNPFCPQKLIDEANLCKERNMADYNHIWLGMPLEQGTNYLIAAEKIEAALRLKWNDERHPDNSVMSVDLSASGGDLCVAKKIVQRSMSVWEDTETIIWSEADTDITKGKIMNLYAKWKPDVLIGDADGLGYPIICSLKNSLENVVAFRGAMKAKNMSYGNARADGYMALKEMLECGFLKLNCSNTARQIEYMKTKWSPNSGRTFILDKEAIRKEQNESPDYADALMMSVYAIYYCNQYFLNKDNGERYKLNTDFEPYDY